MNRKNRLLVTLALTALVGATVVAPQAIAADEPADAVHPTIIGEGQFAVTPSGGVQSLVGVFSCEVVGIGAGGFVLPPGPGAIAIETTVSSCTMNGKSAPSLTCPGSVCATATVASFIPPRTTQVCWSGSARFFVPLELRVVTETGSGCSSIGVPDLLP